MTMVAEMAFEYFGDDGVGPAFARLYSPEEVSVGEWRCRFTLSWPGFEQSGVAHSVDSWGALINATKSVPACIFATADFKAGRIGQDGRAVKSMFQLNELMAIQPFKSVQA